MASLPVPRRGICGTCGRNVPGILKDGSLRECEGECPRCGRSPFYLDSIGPWTDNVARMLVPAALLFIAKLDDEAEIEVLFRVEFMGPNRDAVLHALHKRYWKVNDFLPSATARGRAMTLAELRAAWSRELEDDATRIMYEQLGRVV
jgi:hypothetical protein